MIVPTIDSPRSVTRPPSRGAFIVLEGVDRCGKTTQCGLLVKKMLGLGLSAMAMRFPDRTTPVGTLINGYLQSSHNLDDRAIHLLFSANRWEAAPKLEQTLSSGTHVVCDRYAHSGVAFSAAKKGSDPLSIDWCKGPDVGLPAPDVVIFLDLSQEESEKRGGYGGERYEKREMQVRVRERFDELQNMDQRDGRIPWKIIDAAQSVEDVEKDIEDVVQETVELVENGKPLEKLWTNSSNVTN